MSKEIERKFLVEGDTFKTDAVKCCRISQCYLSDNPEATVRVRRYGDMACITVKGITRGAVRDEWEYPIPVADAEEMASRLAGGWAIDKTRYYVERDGLTWEIDEFHGRHAGLILAEVELPDESTPVSIPDFISREVTGDPAYYNSVLARR